MPWSISSHLVLAVLVLFIFWYVGTKLVNAFVFGFRFRRRRVKIVLFIIAVCMISVPLFLVVGYFADHLWTMRVIAGENRIIDYLTIYPYWIGLICIIQLGFAFLVTDLIRIIFLSRYRRSKENWLRVQGRYIVAFTLLMICYVLIKSYYDTSTVRVSIKEYRIPHLPEALDGFRIVHVSDIQVDNRTNGSIIEDAVALVRSLHPDLTIFTGDLVTGGTRYFEEGGRVIGGMNAKYGTYACIGNHDVWSGADQVIKHIRENGAVVVEDSTLILRVGTSAIELFGINNYYGHRVPPALFSQKVKDPADLRIVFTHSATRWLVDSAAARGYDIFMGGHSHGGQVAFGLPWWPIVLSRVETPYVAGFYTVGSMLVSVTNGIGLTLAPLRFQAPAEISLIIIRSH